MKAVRKIIFISIILSFTGCYLFAPKEETPAVLSISPRYIELKEGEQATIDIAVEPAELQGSINIEYVMENEDYAEVEGGTYNAIVTAHATGASKLLVKGSNGSTTEAMVSIRKPTYSSAEKYIKLKARMINIQIGQSAIVAATLVGGTALETDQLVWTVDNPSLIKLKGSGGQVLIEALKEGSCIIKVSHPLVTKGYEMQAIVGQDATQVRLSKTYLALKVGEYADLSAVVDNATTIEDQRDLTWEVLVPEGSPPIAEIIGSQNQVAINALRVGEQKIVVRSNKGKRAYCDVVVSPTSSLSVSTNEIQLQPNGAVVINYTIEPVWEDVEVLSANKALLDIVHDKAAKIITIRGKGIEGTGTVSVKTSTITQTIYVACLWVKDFTLAVASLQGVPGNSYTIPFTATPPNSVVSANSNTPSIASVVVDAGMLRITGVGEGNAIVTASTQYGFNRSVNCSMFHSTWSTYATFTNVTSPIVVFGKQPAHGIRNSQIVIGEGGTARIDIQPNQTGLAYKASFSVSPAELENNLTYSVAGNSIVFTYPKYFSAFDGEWKYGTLTISVEHLNTTDPAQILTYDIIGAYFAF